MPWPSRVGRDAGGAAAAEAGRARRPRPSQPRSGCASRRRPCRRSRSGPERCSRTCQERPTSRRGRRSRRGPTDRACSTVSSGSERSSRCTTPVRLGVEHVGARAVARERVGDALAGLRVDHLDAADGRAGDVVAERRDLRTGAVRRGELDEDRAVGERGGRRSAGECREGDEERESPDHDSFLGRNGLLLHPQLSAGGAAGAGPTLAPWTRSRSREGSRRRSACRWRSSPTAPRARSSATGTWSLSYGSTLGYGPLREWLAERHSVEPGRVLVTNGSLQAFHFVLEAFTGRGRVLVERPTYDRPRKILAAAGIELGEVPVDEHGLDVDELERELGRVARLLPLHDPDLPEPDRLDPVRGAPPPARGAGARARAARARGRSLRARALRGRAAADRSSSSKAARG